MSGQIDVERHGPIFSLRPALTAPRVMREADSLAVPPCGTTIFGLPDILPGACGVRVSLVHSSTWKPTPRGRVEFRNVRLAHASNTNDWGIESVWFVSRIVTPLRCEWYDRRVYRAMQTVHHEPRQSQVMEQLKVRYTGLAMPCSVRSPNPPWNATDGEEMSSKISEKVQKL